MRHILSIILLCCTATLAQAEGLTDAEIQKWTKAYQAIVSWAEKEHIEDELDANTQSTEYSRVFSQMMEQTRTNKHYNALVEVLDDSGYSDPNKWSATGDRIMTAYMANEMAGNEAEVEQQLKQVQSMMASGMMPAEQKAMMEQMLQESSKALKAAKQAPEGDKQAVKRNQPLLESVFGAQD